MKLKLKGSGAHVHNYSITTEKGEHLHFKRAFVDLRVNERPTIWVQMPLEEIDLNLPGMIVDEIKTLEPQAMAEINEKKKPEKE